MFDNLKANGEVQNAIANITKVALWGFLILSAFLIAQKTLGFTFDLKVGLGL